MICTLLFLLSFFFQAVAKDGYSIAIALEDFIPVILTAIGLVFLVRMLRQVNASYGQLAIMALLLIPLGGALKALWKLIIAATGSDIEWMYNALFPMMAPGFVCLAWALWCARPGRSTVTSRMMVWLVPLVIVAITAVVVLRSAAQGGRRWAMILLALLTLGNTVSSLLLIYRAWHRRAWLSVFLFLYNLVTVFVQARLARMDQTIALQWIEQINNTLCWAAFAVAAWKLWQREAQLK